MPNLADNDWGILLERIQSGKCTPFLGAGVNYGFLPTGAQIARNWADKHSYPLADREDLARVAQFLAIDKDPMWPKEQILKEFRESAKEQNFSSPENPLALLAELPLPVYITTNYDDYLAQALHLKGKEPRVELCRWNSQIPETASVFARKSKFVPTPEEPVIFHLHGHQDHSESLVLTEDDYLQFLVALSRNKDLLPSRIQEALAGTSLLFIGYRMADWDFRVVLHGVLSATEKSLRRTSVSVQLPPDLPEELRDKAQAYLEKYFKEIQVRMYWGTATQFTQQLRALWNAAARAKTVNP